MGQGGFYLQRFGTVALVIGGIISCGLTSQSLDWGKGSSGLNLAIAPIVNQASSPLIIGDEDTYMLSLSYLVKPGVEFKLLDGNATADTLAALSADITQDKFLYVPSNQLLEAVTQIDTWQLKALVADTPWFGDRPILYQLLTP